MFEVCWTNDLQIIPNKLVGTNDLTRFMPTIPALAFIHVLLICFSKVDIKASTRSDSWFFIIISKNIMRLTETIIVKIIDWSDNDKIGFGGVVLHFINFKSIGLFHDGFILLQLP